MMDREAKVRVNVRSVAVAAERHRCVGVVLAEVGRQKLQGHEEIAAVLDQLATRLEHPEGAGA